MTAKMKKSKVNLVFTLLLVGLCLGSNAQTENAIIGKWEGADGKDFMVEIYLAKDHYFYGKVASAAKATPNSGKIILNKFIYSPSEKAYAGTMSPPDSNTEISAKIVFVNADKLKITARKFVFTKTMYLTRVK